MVTTNQQRRARYNKKHPDRVKQWYQNNKNKFKEYRLKKYGLTIDQYKVIQEIQNNKCAICGKPEIFTSGISKQVKDLSVDHDHNTGKIRGLLCHKCNNALGLVEDNITILTKMIEYLKKHCQNF